MYYYISSDLSYICPLQSEIAMSNMQNKFIAELLTKGMEGGNL